MRRLLPLCAVLAVIVAACDGSDDGGPTAGGTLRVAVVESAVIDPALATDRTQASIADLVFDGLVAVDAAGAEAVPAIAAEWEATANQRRFTFVLRDDARFHDGSPVSAADVKASWERLVAPATGSPLADLLAPVRGFDDARDGADGLAGVRAPDERTLIVELSEPLSDFVLNLTHPALGVLPAGRVRPERTPIGSGPFAVASRAGGTVTLERAGEGAALVDSVELEIVSTSDAAAEAVAEGTADITLVPGTSPPPAGASVVGAPYLAVGYYAMNLNNPKLADERFRSAIALAVDRSKLVDRAYEGAAGVADSVVSADVAGDDDHACDDRCGADPERAATLLRQVFGREAPPTLFLDYDETDLQERVARELRRQLADAGIPAELRPHPPGEYDEFLANGAPELFRFGWVGEAPAARDFLEPVFVPGSPENVLGVDAPALVRHLNAAGGAETSDVRDEAYHAAQRTVMDQWAVIPLAQFTTRYAAGERVRDLEISVFGTIDGARVWIEEPS